MIGLFCFALALLGSPFKSKLRLEAENAVLRVGIDPGVVNLQDRATYPVGRWPLRRHVRQPRRDIARWLSLRWRRFRSVDCFPSAQ
ncbi:hypothetical protein [Bradyrhizobium sp. CB3481]|uniref:hypothetical protein n=1 Tax=Bradyrhizobium sp. CB3481 TaxID=3039158 RepID=UPI0024B0BC0B|nr:hypothetical protein [Bradyrhizobium sp. CB3481]WFU14937.1 hypothetical protein QA643_28715 [Bradyrhizobium sp. CB3481]